MDGGEEMRYTYIYKNYNYISISVLNTTEIHKEVLLMCMRFQKFTLNMWV